MGFVEKFEIFSFTLLVKKRPRKSICGRNKKTILHRQQAFIVLVKNWQFFHLFIEGKIAQRVLVLFKNWQFFHLFILGKIAQENVFHDILERKNASLAYEKRR